MAVIQHNGYSAAAADVAGLTTALNNLNADAQAVSSAIDNTTALDLYDDLEMMVTFAVAPAAAKTIDVYMLVSLDGGTSYGDGDASVAYTASHFVGSFSVRNVATAQVLHLRGVQLPPGFFKYQLINKGAQAFSASGNKLRRRPYNLKVGT